MAIRKLFKSNLSNLFQSCSDFLENKKGLKHFLEFKRVQYVHNGNCNSYINPKSYTAILMFCNVKKFYQKSSSVKSLNVPLFKIGCVDNDKCLSLASF